MKFHAPFLGTLPKNKMLPPSIILNPRPHIKGYNLALKDNGKKRALLSYLVQPVRDELEGKSTVRFSNDGIVLSWVKVLNELGYIVDVINWDDRSFVIDRNYDLIVYHGGKNFEHLSHYKEHFKKAIYFSSGSYWKFHNQQENKRFADFKKRHGIEVSRDRYIDAPEEDANRYADAIVALGDPSMAETYPFGDIYTINNASFPDDHFDKSVKNFSQAKNNFLYFAGSGNIHKGLDLLIDSFKDLAAHLYIVGNTDAKVMDVFKRELSLPNIHVIGEVGMRTKEFYDAVDRCAFTILPSCSEGQAGSVVECMNQGLIPIVSKETRLDTKDFGFTLKTSGIPEICDTVNRLSALPAEKVSDLSKRTRQNTILEHSPAYFKDKLKKILKEIIQA